MPIDPKTERRSIDRRLVEYDDKFRSLDLWRMDLVPPEVGIFDEPTRCYPLNNEWAKIVMGLVTWLAETPIWRDAENEGYFAISEILKFMIGVPCMGYELRQNPTNPCLLEQSVDGGENWTTAFDFDLCKTQQAANDELLNAIDNLTQLLQNFDGSVGSVAPNMVYDATATDDIRDLALCAALQEFVTAAMEAELQRRDEIALGAAVTGVVLGIVSALLVVFSAGTATPAALALASALAGGFATVFDGINEAVLDDGDAQQAVACCMYDYLAGSTISQTDFENSLSGCAFDPFSNEGQLAGALANLITADDMYEGFLDLLQRTYKLAEYGLADCPCTTTWTSVLDLTISDYGFVFDLDGLGADIGQWTNGVGLQAVGVTIDSESRKQISGSWFFDDSQVTSWRVEGEFTKGSIPGFATNYVCIRGRHEYDDSSLGSTDQTRTFNEFTTGVSATIDMTSDHLETSDEFFVFFRTSLQSVSGDATITKVTISGNGTKPPQLP